ncbi:MAG TPA: alpha/beta fold hydrolase [Gammaproteobacteria bacterium]|nr:alpha/beta fold hydrolase [Gammaproteobacteria bacterium]
MAGMLILLVLVAGLAVLLAMVFLRRRGDFLEVDGLRLHYREEGGGEAVVLLHGFAVHGDLNWRRTGILRRLRRRYRVVVPDLRGHGLSDKPHDEAAYGLELVHDLRRLLDHLGLARVHLVGYSLGGFIALKAAELLEERLLSVTLLGAGWADPADLPLFRYLDRCGRQLAAGHAIPPPGPPQARPGRLYTWLTRLFTAWLVDQRALGALVRSLHALTLSEPALRGLKPPVCAIIGDRDYLLSMAERLVGRVPRLEFHRVRGAGHLGLALRGEMHRLLVSFLRRWNAQA